MKKLEPIAKLMRYPAMQTCVLVGCVWCGLKHSSEDHMMFSWTSCDPLSYRVYWYVNKATSSLTMISDRSESEKMESSLYCCQLLLVRVSLSKSGNEWCDYCRSSCCCRLMLFQRSIISLHWMWHRSRNTYIM